MKNSEELPAAPLANPGDADSGAGTPSDSAPNGASRLSPFDGLKIPVSLAIGFLLGETIGKDVGAGYPGFGQISGSRIGEWIGFAVGISAAITVVGLFMTKGEPGTQTRRILSCIAIAIAFMVSALVAIVAESSTGELGGPLAFIAFWLIVGVAVYLFAGKRK